jgi:hypothetical protein
LARTIEVAFTQEESLAMLAAGLVVGNRRPSCTPYERAKPKRSECYTEGGRKVNFHDVLIILRHADFQTRNAAFLPISDYTSRHVITERFIYSSPTRSEFTVLFSLHCDICSLTATEHMRSFRIPYHVPVTLHALHDRLALIQSFEAQYASILLLALVEA